MVTFLPLLLGISTLSEPIYGGSLYDELFSFSLKNILHSFRNRNLPIGDKCAEAAQIVLEDIVGRNKKEYAFRMLDATGKFSSGLLSGNLHALGDFDECVSVRYSGSNRTYNFLGTYMTAFTPFGFNENSLESAGSLGGLFPNMEPADLITRHENYHLNFSEFGVPDDQYAVQDLLLGFGMQEVSIGLCVPSLCTSGDVEIAISDTLDQIVSASSNGAIDKFPLHFVIGDYFYNQEVFDNSSYYNVTAGDICALVLIAASILLGIFGSLIQVYVSPCKIRKSLPLRLLTCFSIYGNVKKLMSIPKKTSDTVVSIFGLKALSISWVILGHSFYLSFFFNRYSNVFDYLDFFSNPIIMLIFAGQLAVDSFFTIGGFLMSNLFLKTLDKTKGKFNPFLMYLHRYIRLTPTYLILMLIFYTLPLHLAKGPFRKTLDGEIDKCRRNWWTNALYVNNIVNVNEQCMGESWYLAVDFQLFIISPFIVWPLWKYKRLGVLGLGLCLCVSAVIPATLTYYNSWPPIETITVRHPTWGTDFYYQAFNRAGPYFIGILFGYLMYKIRNKEKILLKKFHVALAWTTCTALALTLVFSLQPLWPVNASCFTTQCFSTTMSVVYNGIARISWAVLICWIIFACETGYGGVIKDFLTWPVWIPISRVSYIMYLSHVHVMMFFNASKKQTYHFDRTLAVYWYLGHLIITIVTSIGISILFESPIIGLEKIVFGRDSRPTKKSDDDDTTVENKVMSDKESALNSISKSPNKHEANEDLPNHNRVKTDLISKL